MTTDPLGRGMHNDINAVFYGAHKVSAHTECVVDNNGHAVLVCHNSDTFEIRHSVLGIRDGLEVDGFGVAVDGFFEFFGRGLRHKFGMHAELGEEYLELVVRTAVQGRGRHDVVAVTCEGKKRQSLRRLT